MNKCSGGTSIQKRERKTARENDKKKTTEKVFENMYIGLRTKILFWKLANFGRRVEELRYQEINKYNILQFFPKHPLFCEFITEKF